jgi:pimeloyl-ACP methyl ester carboxylesterase
MAPHTPGHGGALLAALGGHRPEAPPWFDAALANAPERSQIRVEGASIEVLAWGRVGDPGVLLLHGNGAHADWYSFIAPLLATNDGPLPSSSSPLGGQAGQRPALGARTARADGGGRRVVAMSFSGMGGSDWREAYSISQWADEAIAAAEHGRLFDAPRRPLAVGHSFGGFPLMTAAARHGDRLGGAVIVDTPLRPPAERAERERQRRQRQFRPSRVYATVEEAVSRFRFLPPQDCELLCVADHIARTSLKPVVDDSGRPGVCWRFDPFLFKHFTFGEPHRDLGRARCPVVLVRGGRSRLVTREGMAHAVSLAPPGTEVREIADADHHVMVDQPLAFAALLAELADRLCTEREPA